MIPNTPTNLGKEDTVKNLSIKVDLSSSYKENVILIKTLLLEEFYKNTFLVIFASASSRRCGFVEDRINSALSLALCIDYIIL